MDTPLHVVLGARGNAGSALVRELTRRGARVRAVSRREAPEPMDGAEWVVGDVAASEDRAAVYDGAAVLYLAAQPLYTRWQEDFPRLIDGVLAGSARAGASIVHVDNAYMYGAVEAPLIESLPYRPVSAKGRVRARIAERLMQAHQSGEVRVTIGRASDYFGPNVGGSVVGDVLFADIIEGKTPRWIGSLDVPHSVSYIDDVARALVTLGTSDHAWGEVWHLPCAPAITGREFLRLACEAAGRPPAAGVHGRLAMTVAGWFSAIVREVKQEMYQWEHPWVLNADKFLAAFGPCEPTPLPVALQQTVDWYRNAWSLSES